MIVNTLSEYIFILLYFTSYSDRVYFYINILYTDSAEKLLSFSSYFSLHLFLTSSASPQPFYLCHTSSFLFICSLQSTETLQIISLHYIHYYYTCATAWDWTRETFSEVLCVTTELTWQTLDWNQNYNYMLHW